MKDGFHARAWLAWLVAAALFTISIDNPVASIASLLVLGAVAVKFRSRGPEGRTAWLFFKIGLLVIAIRVVLFGLTGHPGSTTLFTLPSVGLPRWLGGFSLGGRVTGEVVAQQVAEGLKITAFLACFGVFLASVEVYRLLRMLPRFLFEAGLVVGIAVTFVPSLLRNAAEIRDAQRLRGHRFRGLRSLRPLVLPVLSGALERSLTLAASMESRGFGRAPRAGKNEMLGHLALLSGLILLCVGGGCALAGATAAALVFVVAGALVTGYGLRALSVAVTRTRLRAERLDTWDWLLVVCAAIVGLLTIAARVLPAAQWYAFPTVHSPDADLRLLALAAGLGAPLALGPARAWYYRLVERRHPFPSPEAVP